MGANLKKRSDDYLEFEGRVKKCLPGTKFIVELVDNQHEIFCTLSGRMRRFNIRLVAGDTVRVEISPYDLEKGRICRRLASSVYFKKSSKRGR